MRELEQRIAERVIEYWQRSQTVRAVYSWPQRALA